MWVKSPKRIAAAVGSGNDEPIYRRFFKGENRRPLPESHHPAAGIPFTGNVPQGEEIGVVEPGHQFFSLFSYQSVHRPF